MPLVDYLTEDRVVFLAAKRRKDAINELAELAAAELPQLEVQQAVEAVESIEEQISTCIYVLLQVLLGVRNHQVHIEWQICQPTQS